MRRLRDGFETTFLKKMGKDDFETGKDDFKTRKDDFSAKSSFE